VALQPRKSNNRKLRGLCPQASPRWALLGGSEGPRTEKQLPRRRVSGLRRSAEQMPLQTLSASHNAWRSVSTQWLRAASLRPTRDWSPLMHGCRRQGSQNAVSRRWPMASTRASQRNSAALSPRTRLPSQVRTCCRHQHTPAIS
jgi:hypothetical protein